MSKIEKEVEEDNEEIEEDIPRKKRPSFEKRFQLLQEKLCALKSGIQSVGAEMKKLYQTHCSELKKAGTKKKKTTPRKATGLACPRPIPKKLAEFIGVEEGTELPCHEITSKVWDKLKELELYYKGDDEHKSNKRVLRVNEQLSDLFNIPLSVNESIDYKDTNGFNFRNLQTHIKYAMTQNLPTVNEDTTTPIPKEIKKEKPAKVLTK